MTGKETQKYKEHLAARHRKYKGFGEEHTNAEWARKFGLDRAVVWRYLQRGLTIEEIAELRGIKYPPEQDK